MTGRAGEAAYQTILLNLSDGIAWVTLNRPSRANAVNAQLAGELMQALTALARDERARVVVLTGAGTIFCGGADLKSRVEDESADGIHPIMTLCDAVARCEIPVITAINGPALGGGCELVLASDLRVMSTAATIGVPEIRFGVMPRAGGTQRLPRQVGALKAKEMILTGQPVGADEALRIGLVNRIVQADNLADTVRALALSLAGRPRYALSAAKFAIDTGLEGSLAAGLALEARTLRTMATAEQKAQERRRAAEREVRYAKIFDRPGGGPVQEEAAGSGM